MSLGSQCGGAQASMLGFRALHRAGGAAGKNTRTLIAVRFTRQLPTTSQLD